MEFFECIWTNLMIQFCLRKGEERADDCNWISLPIEGTRIGLKNKIRWALKNCLAQLDKDLFNLLRICFNLIGWNSLSVSSCKKKIPRMTLWWLVILSSLLYGVKLQFWSDYIYAAFCSCYRLGSLFLGCLMASK